MKQESNQLIKTSEIQQNNEIKSESENTKFVSLEENIEDDISVKSFDSSTSIHTPPNPRLYSGPLAEEYIELWNKIDIEDESWEVYANPHFTEFRRLRSQKKRLVWDNQVFDKFTPVWKQLKGKIGRPKGRSNVTIDEQICLDMIDAEELEIQKQQAEKRDKEARESEQEKNNSTGTKRKFKERKKNLDIQELQVTGGNVSSYLGDYLQTRSIKVKNDAFSYSNNNFKRK